jgi:hypothetical protein
MSNSIEVKNMVKGKKVPSIIVTNGKKGKKRQSWVFPFQFEFVTPTGLKAIHALKRKEGEYNSATVADRLKQLYDPKNSKWHSTLAKWQEDVKAGRKKKPDRNLRVRFAYVKVKDIVIDDDIQRDMDPAWVAEIFNPKEFETEFMSAIYCMYDAETGKYISINAQHTLVLETAIADHDLWDNLDNWNGDPMELEVPVIFVNATSRNLCRKGFRVYNGSHSKSIEPYINHKMLVLIKRVDGDKSDKEAFKADAIQTINEKEGYEPISRDNKAHKKFSWAITCIDEMVNHYDRPERWRFVLRTHKRYWPNIRLDTAEVDLYGFIYDYFTELKYDVYSEEFNEQFLDPCMAIIWKFFTTPGDFKLDSAGVQKRFYSAKTGLPEEKCKTDDNGSVVYLMKLYRHFGGKHELPLYVNNLDDPQHGDLLKFVDSERTNLIEAMKEYGQS